MSLNLHFADSFIDLYIMLMHMQVYVCIVLQIREKIIVLF